MYLILFFIFLFLSAFFSASETAIFSLSKIWVESFSIKNKGVFYSLSGNVLKRIYRRKIVGLWILNSILAGNTIVNVAATVISAYYINKLGIFWHLPHSLTVLMDVVGMTFILLVVGEITPKYYAIRYNRDLSKGVAPFIYLISFPLTLVSFAGILLSLGVDFLMEKFFRKHHELPSTDEVIEESHRQGKIMEWEARVFKGIVQYDEIQAGEIMTVRSDMVYIYSGITVKDVRDILKKHAFSRYPVFEKGKEDIVKGILYVKDLIPYLNKPTKVIDDILRPAVFVPEQISGDKLMRVFKEENTHIAVVIDEYGGVAGIVTLGDLISSIVGVIEQKTKVSFIKTLSKETKWLVKGEADIEEVEKIIGIELPDMEYDTIAGFVYDQINKEVTKGDQFYYDKFRFIVKKVSRRRIEEIIIEKTEKE